MSCSTLSSSEDSKKLVLGWVEHVIIDDTIVVKAKLDTGAKTSSIHGTAIKHFKKKGKKWVRFTFEEKNERTGKIIKKIYEKPVKRYVRIKNHKTKSRKRAVVEIEFVLAGKKYQTEFSVTDRKKFIYPILFGRRFLKDVAVIDSNETFLAGRHHK